MKKCHLVLEITHWVSSELDLSLQCEFSYDAQDPLAVTLVLGTAGVRPVTWILSRDLLAEGMTARVGDGDVTFWPMHAYDGEPSSFCVRVGNPQRAVFEIPAEPVVTWLARTYDMVPRGTEMDGVDWDEWAQLAE
ncbi:SsgA family sporulation/cell division regulator (plasmid) [Streptomyces sp. Q6]|uniref:SsgA family sporulation/cell division regulator n=1 Tax=Streptomyces citrinus TaxID=3118173 RepID=A0ACD5AR76_9ACTN